MITAPSTPPPTRRNLIPDSAGPPTDAPSIPHEYAPLTPDSNTSSPRNAVAKRLNDLNLRSLDAESVPERASPRRKRARSAESSLDAALEDLAAPGQVKAIRGSADVSDMLNSPPIERANQPHGKHLNTSGICAGSALAPASAAPARRRLAKPKSRRKQSPPSPPKASSAKPDPQTWQDHEITGHLLLDPDDDGYGINGIGFRPTPALAYERSQKRKMQLNAWKVRESSEARERRGERRRRLDGDGDGGKVGSKPSSFVDGPAAAGDDDDVGEKRNRDGEGSGKPGGRIVRFA